MLTAIALVAAALAPATYSIDPTVSSLRYSVVHKLHQVEATSKEVEGKALVRPDGTVLTQIRAQVASFKSGDGNRDEHMLETMNIGQFPFVTFKGIARAEEGPARLDGQVELHGVTKPYPIPVVVERLPDGALHVTGKFDVSLTAHRIERPSLLLIPLDDACTIAVDLLLRETR